MISDLLFNNELAKKKSENKSEGDKKPQVNSGGYQLEDVTLETRKKSNKRRRNNDK
jgi:hypothetical protein